MDEARSDVERVWREQGATLWRALVAFTGDREIASDAMAEAFAQALGRGTAIRDNHRWVWRASFKIAGGELRRRAQIRPPDDLEMRADAIPEPALDLIAALRALSPNQRAAAVLHYYVDKPTREVAEILGCSQTTVRAHLLQARRRLRTLLEDLDD